jgi:hypothetical protein
MGRKPKAPREAKPPKPKMTPEEQHALFVKAARELGVEEVGEEFERAFDKIVHANRSRDNTPSKLTHQQGKHSKNRA